MKLDCGTWQDVLLQTCKIPLLLDINIDYSGYSLTGWSSHLADMLLRSPDDPQNVESGALS